MLYQLSYSGVSEPLRAATERLIRRGSGLVQGLSRAGFGRHTRRWTRRRGAATLAGMDHVDTTGAPGGSETLDLRGLKCPLPVLRTRAALSRLPAGKILVVRCTDPLAMLDIPNLLRETGDALLAAARDGRETRFTIGRGRGEGAGPAPPRR